MELHEVHDREPRLSENLGNIGGSDAARSLAILHTQCFQFPGRLKAKACCRSRADEGSHLGRRQEGLQTAIPQSRKTPPRETTLTDPGPRSRPPISSSTHPTETSSKTSSSRKRARNDPAPLAPKRASYPFENGSRFLSLTMGIMVFLEEEGDHTKIDKQEYCVP